MIGDREAVDLVPAKAVGMHTCLVWSEIKSTIADITLPDVYRVADIFTS
jgi:FMN phosphatase YigB (HAD superfamily)